MTTVYGLKLLNSHEIRYVGQTKRVVAHRLASHYCQMRMGSQLPVHRWLRKHEGQAEILVLVADATWNRSEIEIIDDLRRSGARLLNCTPGGDGVSGVKLSEETKAKMSKAHGSVVDENIVRELRQRRQAGESLTLLAADYGIGYGTAAAVTRHRTWRWVE